VSLVLLAVLGGCYLSHERARGSSLPPDASAPDAGTTPDAIVMRPACRVECGEPQLVAHEEMGDLEGLLDVAAMEGTLGLLARRYFYALADTYPEYALILVDTSTGAVRTAASADAVRTTSKLVGGGLHVADGGWNATLLRTNAIGDRVPVDAIVAGARWSASGESVWQEPMLARIPEDLRSSGGAQLGVGFGRGPTSFAALAVGRNVYATRLRWRPHAIADPPAPLAILPEDVPGSTPLDGAILDESALVVAGGGHARSLEPRTGFLVTGNPAEAPLRASPIDGAAFDPPPRVRGTLDGAHSAIFRYVSDTTDLAASTLRAEIRDRSGRLVDEMGVRLRDGLVPLASAPYATESGVGLVWLDRDGGAHVLPAAEVHERHSEWRDCGHEVEVPPAATLASGLYDGGWYGTRSLLAWADGADVLVVALEPGPALTVLRIPSCSIVRVR
jgi:hypothetical protein